MQNMVIEANDNGIVASPTVSDFEASFFRGRAVNTMKAYRSSLNAFADHAGVVSPVEALALLFSLNQSQAHNMIDAWADAMRDEGLKPATRNSRMSAVIAAHKAAHRAGIVSYSLTPPKASKASQPDFGAVTVETVKDAIETAQAKNTDKGFRDAAIIALLLYTGMRRAEVAGMALEDFDAKLGRVMALRKGREDRTPVPLPSAAIEVLAKWIERRGNRPGAMFPALSGNMIRAAALKPMALSSMNRLCKSYGVERVHAVRHCAVSAVYERTRDIHLTQAFAGHGSIQTTQKYMRHVESDTRAAAELI